MGYQSNGNIILTNLNAITYSTIGYLFYHIYALNIINEIFVVESVGVYKKINIELNEELFKKIKKKIIYKIQSIFNKYMNKNELFKNILKEYNIEYNELFFINIKQETYILENLNQCLKL